MALRIKIENPALRKEEMSYLDADYSSGTDLTVRNNDSFSDNNFVVAGEPGQEQTEQAQIASTTGNTTVTVSSALKFSHPKSTPIYESRFNKVSVERSTADANSFSEISGSPFDLEWDNIDDFGKITTLIEDSSGSSSGHDYRWRFYNSVTAVYSAYSGTLPGTGLARNTAGFIIQKVRRNTVTRGIPDEVFYDYMNDLQDIVYEQMPKAWWFSKEGTAKATEDGVYKYAISTNWSDLLSIQYVLYNYVSGSADETYPLRYVTQLEFYNLKADSNQAESDVGDKWTLLPPDSDSAKGYIGIHPTSSNATSFVKPVYFFELSSINTFEDTLVIPKPKIYEDYIFYRIYDDIKNDEANANKFDIRVASSIAALKERTRRQKGQRELNRYRGPHGYSRMFGSTSARSPDDYRERYW